MTYAPATPHPADQEPSRARPDSCTCCGGPRQPDPTDEFIGMLKELGHLGMRLARRVVVEVEETTAQVPGEPDTASQMRADTAEHSAEDTAAAKLLAERRAVWHAAVLGHQRLTRSIRLCMVLAVKFHTDRLEREKQLDAAATTAKRARKTRLKGQLENLVKKTIERAAEQETERLLAAEDEEYDEEDPTDKKERLYEDLADRLDEDDIEVDLGVVAQGELYGRICEGLGIQPDWARWHRIFGAVPETDAVPAAPVADKVDVGPPPAPEPEAPGPEAAKPPEPEPEVVELEDPEPEDPEPSKAKVPEPEPAVPKPEMPPLYPSDPMQIPEYQRALARYQARLVAQHTNRLSIFD